MDAEINALAHICKELFPIIDLVSELGTIVGLPTKDLTMMHVSIHEDNGGALILAENIPPKFTPQIKFCTLKTVQSHKEI